MRSGVDRTGLKVCLSPSLSKIGVRRSWHSQGKKHPQVVVLRFLEEGQESQNYLIFYKKKHQKGNKYYIIYTNNKNKDCCSTKHLNMIIK